MTAMPDWYLAFAGAVTAALPADIDEETARAWTANPGGLRSALADALGGSPDAAESGPVAFVNDKTEDGWTLVKDAPDAPMIAAADVIGGDFPEGSEDLLGEPMVELIMGMDGLPGQRQAERLLARPDGIAEELQRCALVFPGTIWRSPDQNHQVPCLIHRDGEWSILFGILEGGFDSRDRLAQSRA